MVQPQKTTGDNGVTSVRAETFTRINARGQQLFFHRFSPAATGSAAAVTATTATTATEPAPHVLVVHGFAEHGARYRGLAHDLVEHGFTVTTIDLRGHGRSEGRRGHVDDFDAYLDDIELGLVGLDAERCFLLGHSTGGLAVLDYAVSRAPKLAGVVVTNPFLALAQPLPAVKVWAAQRAAQRFPHLRLPTGLNPNDLCRDPNVVLAYRRDPLIFRMPTAAWIHAVEVAQARVRGYRQFSQPLLYAYSDGDRIVSPQANAQLAEQLTCADKSVVLRPGCYHEVLNELDKDELIAEIASWMQARC